MNGLNNLILEGKITNDVELTETETGLKFASALVSYSRAYRNAEGETKEEESIFEVECWGNLAEIIVKFSKTKKGVRIVGRLRQKENKVVVIAEHLEFKSF